MAVQLLYLVHGTTADNERGIATGWLPGELSATGVRQTLELGRQLAGTKLDAVYSSDLQRAVHSAELMFGGRLSVTTDERLRERHYGTLDGQSAARVKARMEEHVTRPFPGGESYLDVERRMRSLLRDLLERHNGQRIALIGHQAPQLALEVLLRGRTWPQAIAGDWRRSGAWEPGWSYELTEAAVAARPPRSG